MVMIYRPLVGRTRQGLQLQSDLPQGEVACFRRLPCPAVVRGVAPPTGGYEASDRLRSSETIDFCNSLIIMLSPAQGAEGLVR